MKKTFLLVMPCLIFMALTHVASQNRSDKGSQDLQNNNSAGWQLISSGVHENLFSVHFANSTHGFIGGAQSRCLKSTNGGLNWSKVAVPSYADFQSVWATTPNDAYLGGWDTVYATHNGGQTWTGAYTHLVNYAVWGLQFTSPENGFAFMTWSQFGKTTDRGNSWSLATAGGYTAWDFFDGFMLNENTGWAVGDNSLICKTTNGGETFSEYDWSGYSDFTPLRLWGVHATSASNAYIVADSGVIFRTTDGGNHWKRSTIAGPDDRLTDVFFINASTGYIVGTNGKIFKTTDGGNNWSQEPQVTSNDLNAVFFVSANLGWAVGDNGTILRFGGTNNDLLIENPITIETGQVIFPNSIKIQTSISFSLPKKQQVKIDILGISSRVLKTVYAGALSQGEHIIRLDQSGLSKGMYQCRISIQGKNFTKPFTISE